VKQTKPVFFSDFKFDPANQCVWRGTESVSLTPKSFAVLGFLLANQSRLVTKEELLQEVWRDSYVSDAVLKVCVREIRKALNDDPATPRFIETVHRRGYRFIAPVHETQIRPAAAPSDPTSLLIGRDSAVAKLEEWLTSALTGRGCVVFITGDPGAGKSTLAEAFLQRVPNDVLVARGHALEQYGSTEAYMPVLEAFTSLCRNDRGSRVARILEMHAPTWLAQMPSIAATMSQDALRREVLGATRERMLREMAEAVEALTSEVPLVMLLEDLHWSDKSTIDLVSYLARRQAAARVMLIATYRPVDVILAQHPLKSVKQDLQLHGMCRELPLDFLPEESVREYFNRRFSPNDFDAGFSRLIHSRTDGNPLFMVTEGEFLKNSGRIAATDGCWKLQVPLEQIEVEMPESLRELIERQFGRIGPESQTLLQVASIAGSQFSSKVISFGSEFTVTDAEEIADALTRRGLFIRRRGVANLPDGTVASQYEFIHSLYQNVFYDLVPMGKRLRLHLQLGEGQEALYGSSVSTIAPELAMHFEEGRDYVRAAIYLFMSAETASRRYAYREAVADLKRARELIGRLPESDRVDLEIATSERLGLTHRSMGDMRQAADDFSAMVARAHENGRLSAAVRGLLYRSSVLSWFDREACLEAAEQAFGLSLRVPDDLLRAHANGYCAYWRFLYTGWKDEDALASARAIEAAEERDDRGLLSLHVSRHSYFQCMSSNYPEAIRTADRAIALTIEIGDFFDYAMTQFFKGWALLHSGRWSELLHLLDEAVHLAEKNEHYLWKTLFNLELAWLHQRCGSLVKAETLCRDALKHVKTTGHAYTEVMASTLLGHVLLDQGYVDRAQSCLMGVVSRTTGQRILMDWIWEMPLRLGLASVCLRQGNYLNATQNAQRALKTAEQPSEKTYMALAFATLAEIALAEENPALANEHSSSALDLVESGGIPLAAERVYLVAARTHQSRRKTKSATEFLNRASASRAELGRSLDTEPSLRESLLRSSPETKSLRKHGGR
jgi:DNA-binding winged helix-turn-helix (wHTH) protein/tetratricopeptide (TPR) repeat protein